MKVKALKDGDWALGGVEVIYYKKDEIFDVSEKDYVDMKSAGRVEAYKEPKKVVEKAKDTKKEAKSKK
jgi:hypothetical protein